MVVQYTDDRIALYLDQDSSILACENPATNKLKNLVAEVLLLSNKLTFFSPEKSQGYVEAPSIEMPVCYWPNFLFFFSCVFCRNRVQHIRSCKRNVDLQRFSHVACDKSIGSAPFSAAKQYYLRMAAL